MYAPLQALSDMNTGTTSNYIDDIIDTMSKNYDFDIDVLSKFVFSTAILNPDCDDKRFLPLKNMVLTNYYDYYKKTRTLPTMISGINAPPIIKMSDGSLRAVNPDVLTVFQNSFAVPLLFKKWSVNKQVYKPDKDFVEALSKTDDMLFDHSVFRQLPVNTFYIDLEDVDLFGSDLTGCFVTAIDELNIKGNSYVGISYLYKNMTSTHSSIYITYNSEGKFKFSRYEEQVTLNDYLTNKEFEVDKGSIDAMVMQLILYLTSEEPDIEEDHITKSTYRPSVKIKNKFSEIQRWEVGIRYGKAMRLYKQEIKKKEAQKSDKSTDKTERKPVRPHWRNAHWHHFWTGKRGTDQRKLICKWLPPTLVGEGETDIVITKIKK